MVRNKRLLRSIVIATSLTLLGVAAKQLPAAFSIGATYTYVEIDGINYGRFDQVQGLVDLQRSSVQDGDQGYTKVTLRRDFVTDPSFYLWAKNQVSRRTGLRNIEIVTQDEDGFEISRATLRLCQPLSWTVEAATPGLGGFHETVELAVQEISYH